MKKFFRETFTGLLLPAFWCLFVYNKNHSYFTSCYYVLFVFVIIIILLHAFFTFLHVNYKYIWALWISILSSSVSKNYVIDIFFRCSLFFLLLYFLKRFKKKFLSLFYVFFVLLIWPVL